MPFLKKCTISIYKTYVNFFYVENKKCGLKLQGWRVCYYGTGIVGLLIGILAGTTLREPERKVIGHGAESTDKNDKPLPLWKVILQPKVILLCIAAGIRHCGN